MRSSYEGPATVFRHDHNGRAFYTVAIMQTNMDGEKEYAYKPVQFKRGVEVEDHARINIKVAWEKFYKTKDDEVVFYIFICDFTEGEEKAGQGYTERHSYSAAANKIEDPEDFDALDEDVPF
jgi:hypothetical protein